MVDRTVRDVMREWYFPSRVYVADFQQACFASGFHRISVNCRRVLVWCAEMDVYVIDSLAQVCAGISQGEWGEHGMNSDGLECDSVHCKIKKRGGALRG